LKKLVLILCSSLFVCGCSTTGSVALKEVSLTDIANSLQVGATTKDQLIKVMGAPNNVVLTQDGLEIISYEYKRTVPSLWNFTPIVLLTAGSETEVKQLIVLLNKDKAIKEIITNDALLHNRFGVFE
jgi:outer membrane protein assembly factor BamE (lipoprotein component of BamABCDE complex)